MRSENVKKVVKYMIVSILAVYFILNVTISIGAYGHARFIFSDIETNGRKEELISELESLEEAVQENMNENVNTDLPKLGAAVATISYGRDYYALETFILSVILGILIGGLIYIFKNVECKKLIHYVILYVILLVLLDMLCMIVICLVQNLQYNNVVLAALSGISVEGFLDNTLLIAVPYTLIYVFICLIICKTTQDKTKELNNIK